MQTIFKTLNLNNDNLYNTADNKTKDMINTYIEEWKDKGLLKGYFGTLAKNIYSRTRVKNNEILELLIYGAYIEEQSKLDEYEKQVMYDDVNYYYEQGQQEVIKAQNKIKPISIIDMALFLYLLEQGNLEQYIQMTIQYNAQQIYKQVLINIQQQKELEIGNNEFQRIINQQQNTKLCINNDKISGFMDNQLIGLNNQAKVEGIKNTDSNAKVRFIAITDGKETDMCHSLDGQIFCIDKENVFDRYYGETQKELRIERIKCKGLVIGLNLPPISHHFHWCRSTITYQIPNNNIKLEQDKKYSLFDNVYEKNIKKYNFSKLNIDHIDKKALNNILDNMNKVYKDFPQIKEKIKEINETVHPSGGINVQPQEDGTYIMQINRKTFHKEKVAKKMYKQDIKTKYHPKNSNYKDMGIHETGHMILNEILRKKYSNINAIATDWNNNITSQQILNKAFQNCKINGRMNKIKSIKNISTYAIQKDASETIAEAFVDYYVNKNNATNLSKAIVNIMKGMI